VVIFEEASLLYVGPAAPVKRRAREAVQQARACFQLAQAGQLEVPGNLGPPGSPRQLRHLKQPEQPQGAASTAAASERGPEEAWTATAAPGATTTAAASGRGPGGAWASWAATEARGA